MQYTDIVDRCTVCILIAICEPSLQKIWDPRRLTTTEDFTACYGDNLLFICRWCSYLTGNTPIGLHSHLQR
jgi:hypothetical protein